MVTLRPACTAHGARFRALFDEVTRAELRGLPDALLAPLLDVQWRAFSHSLTTYPGTHADRAIELGGALVGRVVLATQNDSTTIVEIALFEAARGQGVGTEVLRALQEEAAVAGRTLTGHVKQGSPAERLYERCGFVGNGEPVPPHRPLIWRARPVA